MVVPHFFIFLPLLVISIQGYRNNSNSYASTCDQHCPIGNREGTHVQYPFGFSSGCKIQLHCSEKGEMKIGMFKVQNVTADSILIDLPANCNRTIASLAQLWGKNFAMTRRNGLLLDTCHRPLNGCAITADLLEAKLKMRSCLRDSNATIICYPDAYGTNSGGNFFEYQNLKQINCRSVVSSIVASDGSLEETNNSSNSSTQQLSLNFQTVELGWWVEDCGVCHDLATCDNFTIPSGSSGGTALGHRCKCNQGYTGDGFKDGDGCRKVSHCNPSRYMSGKCGGTTRVGVLIGGIIAGASLMVVLALFYSCIRKRSKSLKNRMSARRLLCEAAGSSSIPFYSYKDIERATNGFSDKERLGTGAYGTVYAGKLHNDEWVAIKKIKHRDHESIEQVMNEIKLLSSVSHPNLVRLLGCCIENGEQILVYEFMPNGTLSQHLQRERGSGIPWTIRLTIATETAHAIAHLHSAINPPIYHRDIKSSNILLDYSYKSKVADFGLSRFGMMDDSHISTAPQGTPGYLDPQYHQNFHLSDKSDVYSFGVVLIEIITAQKVVDFSRPHSEINLAALAIERIGKGRLDEIIDPFLDPHRDAWTLSSIHKVAELAFRCLAFHRDMRPSMMEVADELEQIRLSSWAPLEENMCMASSVASSCSSPFNGSEKSFNSRTTKKTGIGSRRLIVSQRGGDPLSTMEETKDSSPVSVQDPWLSEQSSPSTNSLLSNVVR